MTETYYRAVKLPHITDKMYRAMSLEQRHDSNGVVVQSILAETLVSFRAGKMDTERTCIWFGMLRPSTTEASGNFTSISLPAMRG